MLRKTSLILPVKHVFSFLDFLPNSRQLSYAEKFHPVLSSDSSEDMYSEIKMGLILSSQSSVNITVFKALFMQTARYKEYEENILCLKHIWP